MTDEEIAEYVRKSRAAQGLPEHVEDPVALAQIAYLFASQLESKQLIDELRSEQRMWGSQSFKRRRTKR